jgi:hypothetical protein
MLLINGEISKKPVTKINKRVTFVLTEQYSRNEVVGDSLGNTRQRKKLANNVTFDPFCTVYDKELNQQVELRYAERAQPKSTPTGVITIYEPRKVTFTNGVLSVEPGQSDLYHFLVNNDLFEKEDGSNAGRAKYRMLDAGKKADRTVAQKKLRRMAEDLIIGPAGSRLRETEQRRLLLALEYHGNVDSMTANQVAEVLLELAEKEPERVFNTAKSKKTDVLAVIQECAAEKEIFWDDTTRHWRWKHNKNGDAKSIAVVPNGKDKMDWFVEFLTKDDNTNVFEELVKISNTIRELKEIEAYEKASAKA